MNKNPKDVVKDNTIYNIEDFHGQVQQVGIDLTIDQHVVLKPKSFVNVGFNEEFNFQKDFGLFIVRSSFSRKGIFCSSGVYDPGFTGKGGVSIYNMSDDEIHIEKGTRIGQMIVFPANEHSMYNGHYNKHDGVESQYDRE